MVYPEAHSALVYKHDQRRAIIVEPDGKPSQVFELDMDTRVGSGWTEWAKPSYIDTTDDPSGHFMYGSNQGRSKEIPPDSFEARYKIVEYVPPDLEKIRKEQAQEDRQRIQALRASLAQGKTDVACDITATDPVRSLHRPSTIRADSRLVQ